MLSSGGWLADMLRVVPFIRLSVTSLLLIRIMAVLVNYAMPIEVEKPE